MRRAVRPDVAEGIQTAIVRFSDVARYTRFMAPLKALSPMMLDFARCHGVTVGPSAQGRSVRRLRLGLA
jgi:hypothetical protein